MPMVKFEPTAEQREAVAALTSAGVMTVEQIAKTVLNPRTGRAISAKTLNKMFKAELAEKTRLEVLALKNLRQALELEGWDDPVKWKATQYANDHIVGLKQKEATADPAVQNEIRNINISFPAEVTREDGNVWRAGQIPDSTLSQSRQDPSRQLPYHQGPTIDSRDPGFTKPLAEEVSSAPPPARPRFGDIPAEPSPQPEPIKDLTPEEASVQPPIRLDAS